MRYLLFSLLCTLSLIAVEKALPENVQTISSLGLLQAKNIDWEEVLDQKNIFKILFNDVALFLRSGGIIKSHSGSLDIHNQMLTLTSSDKISYKDQLFPLNLTAKKMECNLNDLDANNPFSSMTFSQDVHAIFDTNFYLEGEKACYFFRNDHRTISCYPKENNFCELRMDGHPIQAQFAEVDLDDKSCRLQKIQGRMHHLPFAFSSDELFWNKEKNSLILKKNVHIDHIHFGHITSEEVHLLQKNNSFEKIISEGTTQIQFRFSDLPSATLYCEGTIIVDNESMEIRAHAQNPKNPICFQDNNLTIYAEEAICSSIKEEQHIIPQKISLFKNVRFFHKTSPTITGLGCADIISYDPKTKIILLEAEKPKKVLFWQDDNALRISAPEIHITEDRQIIGKGCVRFAFNLEEEEFFQKLFSQYLWKP
ncbi:MAG: hypothetical protein JW769_01045 [Parachlamydiales bacterium]|nr:hypothetical protein [Parachlamydiales bacterium]